MPEFIPRHVPAHVDAFTRGYLAAAEWLLPDNLNRDRVRGWAADALRQAKFECDRFQNRNRADLAAYCELRGAECDARGYDAEECAGHDYYLTRCGAGVGFWDRGDSVVFDRLTAACDGFEGADVYRGRLYFIGGERP
jgi:hypothetical protein